jgi:iron complex outermembrane receptor protein
MHKHRDTSQKIGPRRARQSLGYWCAPFGAALLMVGLLVPQYPASAADAADATDAASAGGLTEIVVTARKRAENLMDVPISVQSFSATELSQANIFDLQSLKDAAGFTFQQTASTGAGGRSEGSIIFRGLQSTYGDVRENSGSLFIDGIFVSGGQASVNTANIDHVEVLKGPQNTYFGRNTFGGAINFITKAPADDFGVSLTASGTDRGSADDVLTLEGPLMKGLLDGRVSVINHVKAKEYTASDGGPLGAEQTRGIEASLAFTPDYGLKVRLNGHYQQDDDSSAAIGYLPGEAPYGNTCVGHTFNGQNAAGAAVPVTLSQEYFCGKIPTLNQLATSGIQVVDANTALPPAYIPIGVDNSLGNAFQNKVPGLDHTGMRRDMLRVSLLADYALPSNWTAAFNIGYNSSLTNTIWDVDRSSTFNFLSSEPTVSEDLTVDARVASDQHLPLRGLVGASYFTDLLQYEQDSLYGPTVFGPPLTFLNGSSSLSGYANERSYVPAVYASLDYDILSNLTATGEVRYQSDKNTDQPSATPIAGQAFKVSETNRTALPRFILRYKPLPGSMVYVSYSEGVQPTLLNAGYLSLTPAQKAYVANYGAGAYTQQPKLESIEFGFKQSLLENRVEIAADFFHGLWTNQQTTTAVFGGPLPPTGTFLNLSNTATVKGFELAIKGLITEKWTASLNINYVHAIWDSYNNATLGGFTVGGIDHFAGNELSRVPSWTGTFSTEYTDHLTSEWDWYARTDVNYTGSMWDSDINIVKTDAYARVNALLGIRKDRYSVELFAKNLFNDSHWDFAERVPNLITPNSGFTNEGLLVQAPDKQEIGARVKVKF